MSDLIKDGWVSRGYIPHFDVPGTVQHVCFHLADSLPRQALMRLRAEALESPLASAEPQRLLKLDQLLDAGYGSCVLANTEAATIMQEALLFGDGLRYRLLRWVVMPNHVHVLFEQLPDWPLGKVVQGWKRYSSRQIGRLACSGTGPLWHRDYWDRFIRSERHLLTVIRYIEENPVQAGLVAKPELWHWSSAFGPVRSNPGRPADG
ncbi:REP-associated tyrosine transposase [Halopseudomonas salegens]|uniref:Type I restriction enzyme, R subunit/putative DNA methylase n=1 Tax=Halopseudomonas salegens TaxID=1434072 RepID=A0A1H2FN12_9GAMM|nr:transposase [Halopseudomonas salegens]SDU08705.1 type I restriction enzyme, R subunit/putative DNA methylase [Halopseudomonas salegens]